MSRPDLAHRVAVSCLFLAKLLAWDRVAWGQLYDGYTGDNLFGPPRGNRSIPAPGIEVPPICQFGSIPKPLPFPPPDYWRG